MTTVINEEALKDDRVNKTIFDAETQAKIRNNLKEAVGYKVVADLSSNFKPEIHHTTKVPFEGGVYNDAGKSLNTREIDSMYNLSIPSLWWLASRSLMSIARRAMH